MLLILLNASYDTIKVVFMVTVFTILLGLPLGLLLEATKNKHILGKKYLWLHQILINIINFFNIIPIFISLIILIPIINQILLDHFTIDLSIVVAMTFIHIFIFAKEVFNTLDILPKELSDTAKFLGAGPFQIITEFLLPEAMYGLINNIVKLIINLIELSLIASFFGLNGLGKLALEKIYYELKLSSMFYVIVYLLAIIYLIKFLGNYIINIIYTSHNKNQSLK